jgi:hypothetical protein
LEKEEERGSVCLLYHGYKKDRSMGSFYRREFDRDILKHVKKKKKRIGIMIFYLFSMVLDFLN